ncbi:uracil phosphoribosyltransferase [Plastoroseomonas arctica]|uniref:Uracil phosphoribosyltransferase n=1 Tax=Plastoroseomonas arctica TaxID=1509237 RepID=A0AAF1KK33_9PROT|nr:uracil phosphoribosyltransferase [Plastoroseomonas arctica]MBR0656250.1 uracil phosphoribosyltransferase [Plastoroseomonas arctica]
MSFSVCDHALLRHRMASLRDRATPSNAFREILAEIGAILVTEALRAQPETTRPVATPLEIMEHPVLACPPPVLVAVLRAGLGLLEGARRVLPEAPIGHIGLVRDETTLKPSGYLQRLPPGLETRGALLLDPMLATGGSAVAAIDQLKSAGCARIQFLCVVAAPEGVARLVAAHPDVPILAAALDRELDARGYILPGLGDAGDRCFGTEA